MNRFKHLWRYCEADKGTDAGSNTVDATGTNSGDPTPKTENFTKEQVDSIVKERLRQEQERIRKAQDKEKQEKETATLAEQQKFKELADKEASRATTLETELTEVKEKAERYEAALTGYLETLKKAVPGHVLDLLGKLDVVDQLEWINTNGEKLKTTTQIAGVPGTPKPQGNQTQANGEKALAQQAAYIKGKF